MSEINSHGDGPDTLPPRASSPLIFIVAGEHSGDALGAKLMAVLRAKLPGVRFAGVGGHLMAHEGLNSEFPLGDIAVMGVTAVIARLPTLLGRIRQTAIAAIAANPDVVVLVDAPGFTHQVAKRIRKARPGIPIVNYVSPTIWAWRPWRARKMKPYVDHVLALLPFEPQAHADLGGPACTYVGHPLLERLPWLSALDPAPFAARHGLDINQPSLLVLPGSRRTEVERLIGDFGAAVALLAVRQPGLQVVIPVMPNVRALVEAKLASWPAAVRPVLIPGDDEVDKFSAFKLARAALAASGTVTLELALTSTPMVVAYKVDVLILTFRHLIKAKTSVLPNLITGQQAIPEFHQEACTAQNLAAALDGVMRDGQARSAQLAELALVPEILALPQGTASEAAARVVLSYLSSNQFAHR